MIGFYSHQTRNIPRAAIWCSGFHICRKSISSRNFLYFFEKLFCISVQSYFWKQLRSVGNDNFIPHDSWSSAVIDRSKSRNEQKFFPPYSSYQLVDHPTQLICIWIFICIRGHHFLLCQHTKKKDIAG